MSVATVDRNSPFSSSAAIGLKFAAVATIPSLTTSTARVVGTGVTLAKANTLAHRMMTPGGAPYCRLV